MQKIGIFQRKIGNFHEITQKKQKIFYEEKIKYFQMKKKNLFPSNKMKGQSKTENKI